MFSIYLVNNVLVKVLRVCRLFSMFFNFLDRSDFVGGIDNEALDFSHLTDEFIQNNNAEASQ